jgi:hypothetical protein
MVQRVLDPENEIVDKNSLLHKDKYCKVCLGGSSERYERYKESYKKYRELHRGDYQNSKDEHKDRKFFGGNRQVVLSRDGYECVICGMTNDEHKELFNRELTIHHIDGNGVNSVVKNNDISNMETLCLKCHGRIDRLAYLSRESEGMK